jgi:hypothetical protein
VIFDASCNVTLISDGAPIFKDVNMVIGGTYNIGDSGFGILTPSSGRALNIIVGGVPAGSCLSRAGVLILYPSTLLMHEVGGVRKWGRHGCFSGRHRPLPLIQRVRQCRTDCWGRKKAMLPSPRIFFAPFRLR